MTIGPRQEKWLQALESGEYRQAKGGLYDGYGYCCLGVACRLFDNFKFEDEQWRCGGHLGIVPTRLVESLGLYDQQGPAGETSLVHMNDGGWSFQDIAQAIRQEPELYFKESR